MISLACAGIPFVYLTPESTVSTLKADKRASPIQVIIFNAPAPIPVSMTVDLFVALFVKEGHTAKVCPVW
jgi:dihydrodipicolinate synthase/N-acetylneuraminate lyase